MAPVEFVAAPFQRLIRYREILAKTTFVEIRGLYANSVLGMAWAVLGPVLLLGLYSIIYVAVFRIQPGSLSVSAYLIYVFAGLVPTISFSTGLSAGTMSVSANRAVLLNTVFPSELLPLRAVLTHSAILPVGILVIAVAAAALIGPRWSFVWLPLAVLLQLMFVTGLVWVLSLLTLAFRDVQQLLQYVTVVLLIVTPIAYTPDMVPAQLKALMYLNPVYYFVALYQYPLVYGTLPPWHFVVAAIATACVSFCGGFALYQKVKTVFYDYV
jgi:homopolymeric O-antigen transport system permease protein